jgi:hypothetical protein
VQPTSSMHTSWALRSRSVLALNERRVCAGMSSAALQTLAEASCDGCVPVRVETLAGILKLLSNLGFQFGLSIVPQLMHCSSAGCYRAAAAGRLVHRVLRGEGREDPAGRAHGSLHRPHVG